MCVKLISKICERLKLPETSNLNLDDPAAALLHRRIIQEKPFLKKLYLDFYNQFKSAVPESEEKVIVELGSGRGFIKEVIPNVVTSDILDVPDIDMVFSALDMPFEDGSIDVFFMLSVLHHIADAGAFFKEALRCLKKGGKVIMIEPANTLWSRFIYKNFHHELFDSQGDWTLEKATPLTGGNSALPWIIFFRDRKIFESRFAHLKIVGIRNHTPLRYLLSGGFTLRQLVPSSAYPIISFLEYLLLPFRNLLGMFMTVELEKCC